MSMLRRLWTDEAGFVISSELVLVATILVIGMVVGLTELRNQVVQELCDVAITIGKVSQTYSFSSVTGHTAATAGTAYQDETDYCDNGGVDVEDAEPAGISVHDAAVTDESGELAWTYQGAPVP